MNKAPLIGSTMRFFKIFLNIYFQECRLSKTLIVLCFRCKCMPGYVLNADHKSCDGMYSSNLIICFEKIMDLNL